MAARILSEYKRQIKTLELEPSMGGCFELTVDDELIYSKLETGEFPDEKKMIEEVGTRLKKHPVM